MNTRVMTTLTATLTSVTPWKLQRKPLTSYATGLNSVIFCHSGGVMIRPGMMKAPKLTPSMSPMREPIAAPKDASVL